MEKSLEEFILDNFEVEDGNTDFESNSYDTQATIWNKEGDFIRLRVIDYKNKQYGLVLFSEDNKQVEDLIIVVRPTEEELTDIVKNYL